MSLPDLFPGFASDIVTTGDVAIFARVGGDPGAPPVILLHGFPETHVMWAEVAGDLARDHFVIVPDLRGYGQSGLPKPLADHAHMSKRAMGGDVIALMDHFGLSRASLFGHDRGGRVAYRLALDHPERVARLAVLDIVPTLDTWEAMDAAFAMSCYHWMFLAQPSPVPEQLIAGAPIAYLEHTLASWTATKSLAAFSPAALAYYRAAMAQPERIAAMCDDYRAGWFVDRLHDEADRAAGKRIGCPVLALWGKAGLPAGAVEEGATPLSVWRQWATDADGAAIAAGHFIPEENPAATIAALRAFLSER